jgi:HAD superfamily hydrolase (TIGR01549 family)
MTVTQAPTPSPSAPRRVRAVFLDVGETIIDETRVHHAWADWLGVPRHTFSAVLGGTIATGNDALAAFAQFRPGFDLETERRRREAAGQAERFDAGDLYPDALPCLEALKAEGYLVGIAGNQSARATRLLRALDLPADVVTTSAEWGVDKPDPAFFDKVAAACGCPADQIAYVGDRVDNDVRPALAAGMVAVHLRRGPWGYLFASDPDAARAQLRIDSLAELPAGLRALGSGS